MRTYSCQTILRTGVKCRKYAEFETLHGYWICQTCKWLYIRAGGKRVEKTLNLEFMSKIRNL